MDAVSRVNDSFAEVCCADTAGMANTAERMLADIRALTPAITARAAEIEAGRRMPRDLVEALRTIEVFRMFVPRSHGGFELDLCSRLEVVSALAGVDGSVGWNAMIGSAGGLFAPDPKAVEDLLQRVAVSLSRPDPRPGSACLGRDEKRAAGAGFGTLAKSLALTLAVIAGLSGVPRSAAADEAPVAFVRTLGTQAVSVIGSAMPLGAKADYFNQMLRQDFDLTGICRFVLGPYWRVASPTEQQQFCDGFAGRLVRFYGGQLAQAGEGDFVVIGSRTETGGVIVTSRIVRPQGAAIAVDWRLGVSGGGSVTKPAYSRVGSA